MTAKEARALSDESKKDKYLGLIKAAAIEGDYSLCVADGEGLMKRKDFFETLGYKVRLLSETNPLNGERWASPNGEISWGHEV